MPQFLFAGQIHKWVDQNGVTHYSDKAPYCTAVEVKLIELPATHNSRQGIENDYYSISNQWMRVHGERIVREQIKLEKAKVKASQHTNEPSFIYINEPKDYYAASYPYFYKHRYKNNRYNEHRKKHRKSIRHYGSTYSVQNKRSNTNRTGERGSKRQIKSIMATKGLTVTIK